MTREDKLALAGDYVLGLLDDAEHRAFEQQAATDPELAAMATDFSERMLALDNTVTPAAFDPGLWARIERKLDTDAASNVTVLRPARRGMAQTRQWLPLAASVVVALGVGYFAGLALHPVEKPTVVAILLNQTDASPAVIVEAFADDSVRLMPLEAFAAPDGQVLQVWTLPDADTGPISLGTLQAAQDLRLTGPDLPLPQSGQLYEITLEPAPGSPTGKPTGPILVKGFAKTLVP
ncbi:MAG: anti-sigma factor [Alphaproteobacteria bacterium]|nr:anti-sigma factor [Alphaproteobacteria bacterium]